MTFGIQVFFNLLHELEKKNGKKTEMTKKKKGGGSRARVEEGRERVGVSLDVIFLCKYQGCLIRFREHRILLTN